MFTQTHRSGRKFLPMLIVSLVLLFLMGVVLPAHSDTITHDGATVNMDFVEIGKPSNAADNQGRGSVNYSYQIGLTEVSIAQFTVATDADSNIADGNEDAWNSVNAKGLGFMNGYGLATTALDRGTNAPASRVTFYEAAKFANWLTSGDSSLGAYTFNTNGHDVTVDRAAALATYKKIYVLPTNDEFIKAAYFDLSAETWYDFSDGTSGENSSFQGDGTADDGANFFDDAKNVFISHAASAVPAFTSVSTLEARGSVWHFWGFTCPDQGLPWSVGFGGVEQNGTYDMMGNVWEWTESLYTEDTGAYNLYSVLDAGSDHEARWLQGGCYNDNESFIGRDRKAGLQANLSGATTFDQIFGLRIVSLSTTGLSFSFK